jgi:hypothetical protein
MIWRWRRAEKSSDELPISSIATSFTDKAVACTEQRLTAGASVLCRKAEGDAMSVWVGSSVRIVLVTAGVLASGAVAQFAGFGALKLLPEPDGNAFAYLVAAATFIALSASTVKAVYWRHPIDRALTIVWAYISACVAAGLALALVYLALSFRSSLAPTATDAVGYLLLPFMMAIFFAVYIAIFALPAALPTIILTERKGVRSPLTYAATGAMAALIGCAIYVLVVEDAGSITAAWIFVAPGTVGGLTYWALAGRNAGIASGAASARGGT